MNLTAVSLEAAKFIASPIEIIDDNATISHSGGYGPVIIAMGPFHVPDGQLVLVPRGKPTPTMMCGGVTDDSIAKIDFLRKTVGGDPNGLQDFLPTNDGMRPLRGDV
jgi:hypothetical protein